MPADLGKITAYLDLDASDFNRQLRRVKRQLVGSSLLLVYSYVVTALVAVLATLLAVR